MLNQHENLVVPKSDRLRVGDCVVDVARREVRAPAAEAPRRITVKALQVLLVLVAQHGKVVSREALLEFVWAGTMPGDDVLTQAITQLRKAFGDERDAPRYLETIAKGGYRLLADVAWLPSARADEVPMTAPESVAAVEAVQEGTPHVAKATPSAMPARRGVAKAVLLAFAACVAVLSVFAFFAWRGARAPDAGSAQAPDVSGQLAAQVPVLAYSVVASQPGLETMPSLSPDGSQLAYASSPVAQGGNMGEEPVGKAIFVQTTAAVTPRRLTEPPAGMRDIAPRWSPDGRLILFVRIGEGRCELLLVAASGGTPWQAGPCLLQSTNAYDWLPDGSGIISGGALAAPDGKDVRLRILALKTGEWRLLPYRANPGDVDLDPHVSPDGRWVVFQRNISNADLWRVPLAGGTPERLTRLQGNIWGWDFTPDGKALVFSYLRNGASLYRYDFASKQVRPLGIESGQHPDIALHAPVLTFEISDQQTGLYRRAAPLAANPPPAQRLFESSGSDLMPSVSPDGARIAFYSDRTRELRLWFGKADGSGAPALVDGFVPVTRQPVRWMADGDTVLAIGYPLDDAGPNAKPALLAIDLRSGRLRRLPVPAGLMPVSVSVMPAQRLLLVADIGAGRLSMRVFDTASVPWRELARQDKVGEARFDAASNAVWFVRSDGPGLWRTDPMLSTAAVNVAREQPWVYWMRLWMLARGKPYSVQPGAECAMSLHAFAPAAPSNCLERRQRYAFGEPTLPGDAGWLYFSAATRPENIDIGTARLD